MVSVPKITQATENYVKQVFLISQESGNSCVPMGELAESLGVQAGTITTMIKRIAKQGWVDYEPRVGVTLTLTGKELALKVIRRHRLVELLLVKILGMDWGMIHEEAEALEHVISDAVLDRIDTVLGYPTVDPHGDPIPSSSGELESLARTSLADCPVGARTTLAQIRDQSPAFLSFCQSVGLLPGVILEVVGVDSVADAYTLRFESGERMTLGGNAAGKLFIQEVTMQDS